MIHNVQLDSGLEKISIAAEATSQGLKKIASQGYCFVDASSFTVCSENLGALEEFTNDYNNLPEDPFMKNESRYRLRRYSCYKYDPRSSKLLTALPPRPYYQSKTYNTFIENEYRGFEPLETSTINNPFLLSLLEFNCKFLDLASKRETWMIGVHLVRTLSKINMPGNPTPEGIHQDGLPYFSVHLINRHNITGGTTGIYTLDNILLESKHLSNRMDSLYANDEMIKHGVSKVQVAEEGLQCGHRDALLVDYDLL